MVEKLGMVHVYLETLRYQEKESSDMALKNRVENMIAITPRIGEGINSRMFYNDGFFPGSIDTGYQAFYWTTHLKLKGRGIRDDLEHIASTILHMDESTGQTYPEKDPNFQRLPLKVSYTIPNGIPNLTVMRSREGIQYVRRRSVLSSQEITELDVALLAQLDPNLHSVGDPKRV